MQGSYGQPPHIPGCPVLPQVRRGRIHILADISIHEKGKGGQAIEDGLIERDGEIAVNPSGGLKARGHPLGATGIAQVAELTWQLRGDAGKRQVDDAKYGIALNIGGTGGTTAVHILSNEKD